MQNTDQDYEEINLKRVADALALAGASSVSVYFTAGSGDVNIDNLDYHWPMSGLPFLVDDDAAVGNVEYFKKDFNLQTYALTTEKVADALCNLTRQLADYVLEQDWQFGAGGRGNVAVYANGQACVTLVPEVATQDHAVSHFDEDCAECDNIRAVVEALNRAGAASVDVIYSGSGDSGDVCGIDVDWPRGTPVNIALLGDVSMTREELDYSVRPPVRKPVTRVSNFDTAVTDLCNHLIQEAGHSGYGDGEGGGGELTILADGQVELDHYDNSYGDGKREAHLISSNMPTIFSHDGIQYIVRPDGTMVEQGSQAGAEPGVETGSDSPTLT